MAIQDEFILNLRRAQETKKAAKAAADAYNKKVENRAQEYKAGKEVKDEDKKNAKKAEIGAQKIASNPEAEAYFNETMPQIGEATKDFINNLRDMMKPENLGRVMAGQPYIPKDQRTELENFARTKAQELKDSFDSVLPKVADAIGRGLRGEDITGEVQMNQSQPAQTQQEQQTQQPQEPQYSAEDFVSYTYKPGDTFGRVLMKVGLSDGRNLWGPNGDVAYYTKQLNDQGIYGNIPIGTTINLRRRK